MKHFTRLTLLYSLPLFFLLAFSTSSMATCTGEIVKVNLRNLAGDKAIKLVDGACYNSADIPTVSRIRAFVSGSHESARIRITGDMFKEHIDNKKPYTFQGEDGIRFVPGSYTIRISLFSENDAQGEMCHVKNINFVVVEGPSTAKINRVKIHNIDGDNSIKIQEGKSYSLGELDHKFKMAAHVKGFHESARFIINGPIEAEHTDNKQPYLFKGDNGLIFTPGDYSVTVQLYSENNLGGNLLVEKVINFNILPGPSTAKIKRVKLQAVGGGSNINLEDGAVYAIQELPELCRLKVIAEGFHESVKFQLSGPIQGQHIDNKLPYLCAGEQGLEFGPGEYTLRTGLYSENHSNGEKFDDNVINFSVVQALNPSCGGEITSVKFNALSGGSDIELVDGGNYDINDLPESFNIEAHGNSGIESIRFTFSGAHNGGHTENKDPYCYKGDNTPNNLTQGTYTLNVKGYPQDNLNGGVCDEKTITFTISGEMVCDGIIEEVVFNALSGGQDVVIENGQTYDINALPQPFNIEAIASGAAESIRFSISGAHNGQHTENWPPYRYKGDNTANNLTQGTYTLNVKCFSANNLQGTLCDERQITFTIAGQLACTGQVDQIVFNALDGSEDCVLENNKTYYLNLLPDACNLEAITSGNVGSVRFSIGGSFNDHHTENVAPYRYKGDNNPTNLQPGQYSIQAKAYRQDHASGQMCHEMQLNIRIEAEAPVAEGGEIKKGNCNQNNGNFTLRNDDAPDADGADMEIVWIKANNSGDCDAAEAELDLVDIGQIYDAFITAGGFGALNPGIGNTSWEFLPDDGDNNDLKYKITGGLFGNDCYMRLARVSGMQEFTGFSNPIMVTPSDCPNCSEPIDGGLIVGDDSDPSSGFVVIENDRSPANTGDGFDTPETIFIKSTKDEGEALPELADVNVGEEYEAFLSAGGFGVASSQIASTSWEFIDDGDEDPLTLIDDNVLPLACYLRCVRAEGCVEFHGDSNPVTISVGSGGGNLVQVVDNEDESGRANGFEGGSDDIEERTDSEETQTETTIAVEVLEALEVQTDESLKVFPNPAHGVVFFATDKFATVGGMMEVYNAQGQLLYQHQFSAGRNTTFEFDLERYALGMYFLRLEFNDGEKFVNRFVVD